MVCVTLQHDHQTASKPNTNGCTTRSERFPFMRNNHGVPLYLQAFLLPSARTLASSKAAFNGTTSPHISDCIVSLHVAFSDNLPVSTLITGVCLCSPPPLLTPDFNTGHVIRSPLKCQPASTVQRGVLFPASVCASACIMLRKSAFICTDSKSGCGRQTAPPSSHFFF